MIFINNKPVSIVNWDFTILQVSETMGISIPRFCYHQHLSISGNCRMCMVEIEKVIKPVIACATSIVEDMVIFTNSELVKTSRENVLELLLINHPLDCPICDQGGECDSQDMALIFGTDRGRFIDIKRSVNDIEFGPIVKTIMTRCIHCTRCVRYAEEIAGVPILGTMGRGSNTVIGTYVDTYFDSEVVGNIVDLCPVGALTSKPYAFKSRSWELQSTDSFDIFDSLVSNIRIDVKFNEIMRVLPRRNDFVNKEWINDKVRYYYEGSKINRLLFPLVKTISNNNTYLVHSSNEFAYNLFFTLYNRCKKSDSIITLLNDNIDLLDSIYYLKIMDIFNINVYKNNYINNNISMDFKCNWLLNSGVNDFIENNNIFILCNVNLKYENAVLNTLIYQFLYKLDTSSNFLRTFYYIGCYFINTYTLTHIGITNNTLQLIQNGKHYICNILFYMDSTFIDSHNYSILGNTLYNYINTFTQYIKSKHRYSYIANNSGTINNLEIGIHDSTPKIKHYDFVYVIGDSTHPYNFTASNLIYSGHHLPKNLIYDIYIPTNSFYELSGSYTISYWLNFMHDVNTYSDKIISAPGESIDNITLFKIFFELYNSKNTLNIERINSFNFYFNSVNDCSTFNIYYNTLNTSFIGNIAVWHGNIFYLSDQYSSNNYVMHEALHMHLKNNGGDILNI